MFFTTDRSDIWFVVRFESVRSLLTIDTLKCSESLTLIQTETVYCTHPVYLLSNDILETCSCTPASRRRINSCEAHCIHKTKIISSRPTKYSHANVRVCGCVYMVYRPLNNAFVKARVPILACRFSRFYTVCGFRVSSSECKYRKTLFPQNDWRHVTSPIAQRKGFKYFTGTRVLDGLPAPSTRTKLLFSGFLKLTQINCVLNRLRSMTFCRRLYYSNNHWKRRVDKR